MHVSIVPLALRDVITLLMAYLKKCASIFSCASDMQLAVFWQIHVCVPGSTTPQQIRVMSPNATFMTHDHLDLA